MHSSHLQYMHMYSSHLQYMHALLPSVALECLFVRNGFLPSQGHIRCRATKDAKGVFPVVARS
jgi:hypothetical protein